MWLIYATVRLHYDVIELTFSFGVYFRCIFVRSFDSSFVFLCYKTLYLSFFLQVVIASKAWTLLLSALRPDRNSLFGVLLNSRANSTAKKYIIEINFFLCGVRVDRFLFRYLFPLPWSPFISLI